MPDEPEPRDLGFCELSFERKPELVSIVRRFVSDFYDRTLCDPDATSRVALATHELLENAVKYSRDGRAKVRIEVSGRGERVKVRIRTKNRGRPEDAEHIQRAIDEMMSMDANVYYLSLMRKNASRTDGSGLGLARIHAEAEMAMSVACGKNGTITVSAETEVLMPQRKEGAA
ncbi:MAG: ATP-binding protein [Myxococcales bacterium]|jgi:anti-sigma regulatory factor (Ser/Thr protein kinase)